MRYAGAMRYAQGGGLTPKQQAAREQLGLEAAEGFAREEKTTDVAREFRVGERQVEKWRRTWREGGAGRRRCARRGRCAWNF